MAKAEKLKSGNWRVRVYLGEVDGKKKFQSITRPTKKEAEYAALEIEFKKQKNNTPSELTVHEAISEYIKLKENILQKSTIAGYRRLQKNQLQSLMKIKLSKLNQNIIQKAVNEDSYTYSPKTIRNAHGLLSAVMLEFDCNFVLRTKLPSKIRFVPNIPTFEQIKIILHQIKSTDIEVPILLALWLGLRVSEIKGLKYSDVSERSLIISRAMVWVEGEYVVKPTKTYHSTRTMPLPAYIYDIIFRNKTDDEFIVTYTDKALRDKFYRLCRKNNLPHFRLHDLRHGNASVMLALGVPDKYAMERTGHATQNMLKDVYQHTMNSEKDRHTKLIDDFYYNLIS